MEPAPGTPAVDHSTNHDTPERGNSNDKTKRKRQPRNSACQICSSMKMKCVPGPEQGKCERCHRMGRDCVPSLAKQRKRRNTSSGGLDSPQGVPLYNASDSASRPPLTPSTSRPTSEAIPSKDAFLNKHDLTNANSDSFRSLLVVGLGLEHLSASMFPMIDYPRVQKALKMFRRFTDQFPFVSVREGGGISMATTRPITTVAVCAITTAVEPSVQDRLLKALRTTFSSKVFFAGDCSIDLANAFLLYSAWYHHHLPGRHIYQELSLLAGMVIELGYFDSVTESEDPTVAAEKDLLFLGSYFLCCSVSVLTLGKPSPLRWTHHLRQRAQRCVVHGTGRLLTSLIELSHVLDNYMNDTQSFQGVQTGAGSAATELQGRAVLHHLKALKREYPELGGTMSFTAATLHLYQHAISMGRGTDTSLIIQCAVMIKEQLDDLLARPAVTLYQMPLPDWTALLEMLVLIGRFSTSPTHSTGWEAGALSSMLQPEVMLDAITKHMASVSATNLTITRNDALLDRFRRHCEDVRWRIGLDKSGPAAISPDATPASLSQFRAVNQPLTAMPSATENGQPLLPQGRRGNVLDDSFWSDLRHGK